MLWTWRLLGFVVSLALAASGISVMAAESGRASIAGTVVDASGSSSKPAANVEVQLVFGGKTDTRKTGADGKYQFGDLLPGKYTVKITAPSGLKVKGDPSTGLSLDGGDSLRADFVLISAAPPTAAPSPSPSPTTQASASSQVPASGSQTASAMPPLVNPLASPSAVLATGQPGSSGQSAAGQQASAPANTQTGAQANTSQSGSTQSSTTQANAQPRPNQPLTGPGPSPQLSPLTTIFEGRPHPSGSPAPLDFGAPSIIASVTGTPQATPTGTPATQNGDVVAASPPRRLITSFEALREVSGGGTTAQLKSWATDTSLLLGVPFRTQIDGTAFSLVNCGPASLSMVLTAFGLDADPPAVRDYLNYLVGNYDTEQGTSLYVLARIAQEAGLNTFGMAGGNLQGWTVEAVREQVRAGHPVITLTKYRRLPGHFGSVTEFDHYIVITGLAGEDFVYNDAAYATEYGYNLLISPKELERAWADSSVPRHALAVGLGDGVKPLPIVPRGLTAESLAAPRDMIAAPTEAPARVIRGPAAERLREEMLDQLGARTAVLDGLTSILDTRIPPTRLDPSDLAAPAVDAVAEQDDAAVRRLPVDPGIAAEVGGNADTLAAIPPSDDTAVVATSGPGAGVWPMSPLGTGLLAGLLLALGGGASVWLRRSGRLTPSWVRVGGVERQERRRRVQSRRQSSSPERA